MPSRKAWWILVWIGLALSCSTDKSEAPPREEVEALLRQEAEKMKREGESDVNPALGVTVTWTIESVEVRPRAGNEAQPWAGTIRFVIESRTPELDGTATDRFERSYDYVWEAQSASWIMQ